MTQQEIAVRLKAVLRDLETGSRAAGDLTRFLEDLEREGVDCDCPHDDGWRG